MKIVTISDTHCKHDLMSVPDGDVLIHAGDFTILGRDFEVASFYKFLRDMARRFKYVIFIAGNHDIGFTAPLNPLDDCPNVFYLNESGVTLDGVRFWGSPRTPQFGRWAFMYDRSEATNVWSTAPDDVDVLITHGPPFGVLDKTASWAQAGCHGLLAYVEKVRPRLHVFGHIHESYGRKTTFDGAKPVTRFINASSLNLAYQAVNAPISFTLEA